VWKKGGGEKEDLKRVGGVDLGITVRITQKLSRGILKTQVRAGGTRFIVRKVKDVGWGKSNHVRKKRRY